MKSHDSDLSSFCFAFLNLVEKTQKFQTFKSSFLVSSWLLLSLSTECVL